MPEHDKHGEGVQRCLPPRETLERVARLARNAGITRVAEVTGLDSIGIPVAVAYRPMSTSLAVSMGKGTTWDAAAASAIMESLELWHAENVRSQPLFGTALDLDRQGFRTVWQSVPMQRAGFSEDVSIAWLLGTSLVSGTAAAVPAECVHVDGRVPGWPTDGWFASSSNGLASGNCLIEAQLHALCEVIERDATTVWSAAGGLLFDTRIDPDSVVDPESRQLMERFVRAGLQFLLYDATTDTMVPTIVCALFGTALDSDTVPDTSFGFGTNPNPVVALTRALTEAAQSRMALISGARDDVFRNQYEVPADSEYQAAQLRTALAAPPRGDFSRIRSVASGRLERDLHTVVGTLAVLGYEPIWVDLSLEPPTMAVGRIVVPGLSAPVGIAGESNALRLLRNVRTGPSVGVL